MDLGKQRICIKISAYLRRMWTENNRKGKWVPKYILAPLKPAKKNT